MAAALPIFGMLGTGLTAISQVIAADAQADAANSEAAIRRSQARDLLRRSEINIAAATIEGRRFVSEQGSSFAKSGVALGTGSSLAVMEDTAAKIRSEIGNAKIDAQQEAQNLILGAENIEQQASKLRFAGQLGAVSTILGGGAKTAQAAGAFGAG